MTGGIAEGKMPDVAERVASRPKMLRRKPLCECEGAR